MSEPNETDGITRELEAIFADYYVPPTEMDLLGVDAATFVLGLCYGFDSWQDVRVVANSRRNVAAAARHWDEEHPSDEFLSRAAGTDERALEHKRLLERAHPGCAGCEERLERMEELARETGAGLGHVGDLDTVDPHAALDPLDLAWLRFQPVAVTRGERDAVGMLHVPDREKDQPITAEHMRDRSWRITIRDPSAREATVYVRWTGSHDSVHVVTFEHDLAVIDADAPEDGARPRSVRIQVTGVADT
jgi:hypothetical protein